MSDVKMVSDWLLIMMTTMAGVYSQVSSGNGSVVGLDLVRRLHDEDAQPDADVGGNHMHQSETGQELSAVDVHLDDVTTASRGCYWKISFSLLGFQVNYNLT